MKRAAITLVASLALAGFASPAMADTDPGMIMRVSGISGPARAGQPIHAQVEFTAPMGATLKQFAFAVRGGTVANNAPPDSVVLPAGGRQLVTVDLVPTSGDERLDISVVADGYTYSWFRDLSQSHWDLRHYWNEVGFDPQPDPPAPVAPALMPMRAPAAPQQVGVTSPRGNPATTLEQAQRMSAPLSVSAANTHHIHGKLRYRRNDGSFDWIDSAPYSLWMRDAVSGMDVVVASGVSSALGDYDETVTVPSTWGRKFYISLQTSNNWVVVRNNDDDDDPWRFVTPVFDGKSGGGETIKSFMASNMTLTPALNCFTVVTRAMRWMFQNTPFQLNDPVDRLNVSYPESNWPHYSRNTESLYIPNSSSAFNNGTLMHETGHHMNHELPMAMPDSDTDDGICNNSTGTGAGHCAWCAEDDGNVAITEGFADWYADAAGRDYFATYGVLSLAPRDYESLPVEGGTASCPYQPSHTEGYYASLLHDLDDDTPGEKDDNRNHPYETFAVQGEDRMAIGRAAVIDLLVDYDVSIYEDLRAAVFARYSNVPLTDRYATFLNAGFDEFNDTTAPIAPTNLRSTDHTAGVSSVDATFSVAWNASIDLGSGVQFYNVKLRRVGTTPDVDSRHVDYPATSMDFQTPVSPGDYYIQVVPYDNAGNHDQLSTLHYAQSPTYVVRTPPPADLAEYTGRPGWSDSIVPRCVAGASSGSATITPFLAGNADSTWLNWGVHNVGGTAVDTTWRSRVLVDGIVLDSSTVLPLFGTSNTQTVLNKGPFTFTGGRHTVEVWTDVSDAVSETNENNNRFGAQFVWKPLSIGRNFNVTRPAPPRRNGSHNALPIIIGGNFNNCDGLRYTHSNAFPQPATRWIAVEAHAIKPAGSRQYSNTDLMLHLPSDGATDGFTDGLVTSSRGAGLLDAIITNGPNSGQSTWDVGVVNADANTDDFHFRVNSAGGNAVGDTMTITLLDGQMLALRDLGVTAQTAGLIVAEVHRTSGVGLLNVSWFTSTSTYRTLAGANATTVSDSKGNAWLSFSAATGQHAIAIWRDPTQGTAPVTFTLHFYKKVADLTPGLPASWYAPIVPRPTNDATSSLVLGPGTLRGDDAITYVSYSLSNISDVATSGGVRAQVLLDDAVVGDNSLGTLGANTTGKYPNVFNSVLPGGRHVITLSADPLGALTELSDVNNTYGEQWVWSPDTLAPGSALWRRGQIGGPMAGWEYTSDAEFKYFDCDGVRMPTIGAGVTFAAVAMTPRDSADVDLTAFDMGNGADRGFETPLEDSYWGPGQTELLLFNYAVADRKSYDVGITRVSDDTTSYLVDVEAATVRSAGQPVHGPFTLGASRLLQLHEFALPVGRHTIHLRNLSGAVDWALAAYDTGRPFQDRSQGEELAWSWENGAGQDEEIVVVCDAPATIAIAVYKTGSAETAKSGSYQLELGSNPLDAAGGGDVQRTRLAAAYPNPFRDGSAVHFDLARAGEVALEVFDLRGARVRTLERGVRPAGRHVAAWDGRDDHGRAAPAGVYLLRMSTADYAGQVKVVRMR